MKNVGLWIRSIKGVPLYKKSIFSHNFNKNPSIPLRFHFGKNPWFSPKFSQTFSMKIQDFLMKNNVEKVWMNSKRWESTQETIPKKINFLRPTKFSKIFWNSNFIKDFLKDNDLEYIRGGQNPKSGITVKDMRKRTLPGDSSSKSVILIFQKFWTLFLHYSLTKKSFFPR